jgi:UDP-3-O-[3-hydroxymyristoyl] glucosamine N-acyltransferase
VKLSEIAQEIDVEFSGEDREINGINTLIDAKGDELSFIHRSKYSKDLANTQAAAVLIQAHLASQVPASVVPFITDEPYLKLALASRLFAKPLMQTEGEEALIGEACTIASGVYLGRDAIIGDNVTLMSGVSIGDNVRIGDDVVLYPNVVVYRDCIIGDRCIIHSGTVIGSDGYGFADTQDGRHIKIYQNGNVVIGCDVEIGANCTIDRAVFGSTIIDDGCKFDNLIQVGHNSMIGKDCLIVSQVGISGSSTLGRNVVMGGQSATSGHLEIGDFAVIHARGGVTKSIEGKKQYAGFPLKDLRTWLKLQGKIAGLLKKD